MPERRDQDGPVAASPEDGTCSAPWPLNTGMKNKAGNEGVAEIKHRWVTEIVDLPVLAPR